MATSYNGWLASRNPANFGGLTKLIVAGESFPPGVRSGAVHTVLNYVAQQLHKRVEPVVRAGWHQADDWGYMYRPTTGGGSLSNHASGTCFDYNATRHPYGKRNTWTEAQVREIRRICAEVNDTVKCLIDHDEMHFEICKGVNAVNAAAAKVRGMGGGGTTPTPGHGRPIVRQGTMNSADVHYLQRKLGLVADGDFGPKTKAAVVKFQRDHGLAADGIVGPNTWRALG